MKIVYDIHPKMEDHMRKRLVTCVADALWAAWYGPISRIPRGTNTEEAFMLEAEQMVSAYYLSKESN